MVSEDPRRPDEEGNPRRPQDRNTERIPPVQPESVGDFEDEDNDTAEFLPPEIPAEELAGLRSRGGMPVGPRSVLPLEEEASSLVSRYLFPTEKFRGEWKKHWIHLLNQILIGTGATFLFGWLVGWLGKNGQNAAVALAVLLWLAIMGWVAWRVADWYADRFVLTNKRLMVINGLVTRTVGMMPLVRVTDMKYQQSPLGRMLNYGTFVVESAGQDQALREVKPLPNPNELYLRIVEEMYEPEAVEARLSRSAEEEESVSGDA
jgi:membrane protein YdbS with pleckstrin-like domain